MTVEQAVVPLPTLAVSGSWTGLRTTSTGQKGKVTGRFVQEMDTFYGPLTIYNFPCFGYEYTTGTIGGSNV